MFKNILKKVFYIILIWKILIILLMMKLNPKGYILKHNLEQ
jgi:hypothetical protein